MPNGSSAAYRLEEEATIAANDEAAVIEGEEGTPDLANTLASMIGVPNLVPMIAGMADGATRLTTIARRAIDDYGIDKRSREQWEERTEGAMKLAMMVAEKKDYPFVGASNVKYPLVTQAALQFNARSMPAILQNERVCRVKTFGRDQDGQKAARAERVSEHLSWQLTTEMPEWEPDTDRMLMILPIMGSDFKKTYFDPSLGRKCSRRVSASRFVINYYARSLEDAPRFTEELPLYPRDIEERIRDGRFEKFTYDSAETGMEGTDETRTAETGDLDAPHLFLEQHRTLDLDDDGYAEPYIVTIHKASEQVCRIVANYTLDTVRLTAGDKAFTLRQMLEKTQQATEAGFVVDDVSAAKVASIRPQTFFTKYEFMPSPDGGFYGMGLGWLLKDTNEAINSAINQLFDAGHLNNIQGGFISASAGIREKEIRLSKGAFKVINTGGIPIKDAIVPFSYNPPSEALFKLLGLMVEYGNDLASIKDVMTGETGGKVMQPTTVLALIEQGLKVFNAIFKRVHRAVKAELLIHSRLNQENLTPEDYNSFFDDQQQQYDPKADYQMSDKGLSPVSDPTVATKTVALGQAQLIREVATGNPIVNQEEATRRILQAAEVPDIDKLIVQPPPPDPAQQQLMMRGAEAEVSTKEATVEKLRAEAVATIAKVEEAPPEAQPQPSPEEAEMQGLKAETERYKAEGERLKVEGLRLANQNALADLKTKDVDVGEDGTVESRTEVGFGALMEGLTALGSLIAQQGEAQRIANQQLIAVMAAPVVPVRDDSGALIGARKVMN